MKDQKILVVEDEKKIADLLKEYLENGGFQVSVLDRGDKVISDVKKTPPDLLILDIMLPGMDGMDICREIRTFSNIPIIMVTARIEEIDRLIGLEIGADDYICKPFSPREVVARVKAILRRTSSKLEVKNIKIGAISLDEDRWIVTINTQELTLTPNEFKLLKVMMANPNRVFSRGELVNHVQGYEFEGYDRTIDSHIKNLRKKLNRQLPGIEVIGSVYGVGYKFNANEMNTIEKT